MCRNLLGDQESYRIAHYSASRQVQTMIFLQNDNNCTSLSLHFAHRWTHKCPRVVQKIKFGVSQPFAFIPVAYIKQTLLFGPAVHMMLSQKLK